MARSFEQLLLYHWLPKLYKTQTLMHEDGGSITWSYGQNLSAHNKRIAHPATGGGNWHLDGCKITERWCMLWRCKVSSM